MQSHRLTMRKVASEFDFDFQLMLMQFLSLATNRSSPESSTWSTSSRPQLKRVSSIARGNTREYLHSSFLDRFHRCLESTKRNIVCTMDTMHDGLPTQFDVRRLEGVMDNLKALGGSDSKQMLETSVLECYSSTLTSNEAQLPTAEIEFYGRIRRCLQPLVQYCIVLKEYYHRYSNKKRISRSERVLPDQRRTESTTLDEETLEKIEQELSKKQFYDLVRAYLKDEEQKIASVKEICRICECRINVQSLQEHVRYCQTKHRLNDELNENLAAMQALASELKKSELRLSIESKKRIRDEEDEVLGEQASTLRKYKKILKYIQSASTQYRNNMEERVRAIEVQEALQDVLMIDDDMIDRFLQLLDERNVILSRLKKNECQHFAVKQLRKENRSAHSSSSQVSVSDATFNMSALQGERLPMTNKKSGFGKENKENEAEEPVHVGRKSKKNKTLAFMINSFESDVSQDEQLYASDKCIRPCGGMAANKLSLKDFEVLAFLGKGAFGQVYLVRRLLTNDRYAMKVVKMYEGLDSKKIQNIANENDIFRKLSGEYLVKAAFSFSEGGLHMLFLEYMEGGDLSHLLANEVYFAQDVAKFYLAEIVLAIEHLHKLNIIHRDLKPQNLVLNSAGHLKLTDFGLSKEGVTTKVQRTQHSSIADMKCEDQIKQNSQLLNLKSNRSRKTLLYNSKHKINLIGTPDYIAPEIIRRQSVDNETIDWWSFGVIVYELLVGIPPFGATTVEDVINNILKLNIEWPPIGEEEGMITAQAQDLIQRLLNPDYKQRLGAEGVHQIKNHAFFKGINWQQIKHAKPPIQPKITTQLLSNTEDPALRKQIEDSMRRELSDQVQSPNSPEQVKVSLNNFVKFDVLSEYTLKSGEETKRWRDLKLAALSKVAEKIVT